jgi:hypothetical protein
VAAIAKRRLRLALSSRKVDRHLIPVALQPETDARTPKLQIAQMSLLEERGQYRVPQPNFILALIELQAERGSKAGPRNDCVARTF